VHLTDPQARAEDTQTQNTTASAGQTQIVVSPVDGDNTVSCVTSVTVEGTSKNKWRDYHWDYQTSTITFFTALSLDDDVVINFKEGSSNWIYSDRPDDKLSINNWPRISVFTVAGGGVRLGQYTAPVESVPIIQVDVWCKNGQIFTIDGRRYSNNYLGRYLANQITKSFEDNESELFNVAYNYLPIGVPRDAPYSEEYQAYHTIIEIKVKSLRLGRLEV